MLQLYQLICLFDAIQIITNMNYYAVTTLKSFDEWEDGELEPDHAKLFEHHVLV